MPMESEVICNFKKCRKPLNTVAWVTSCSHIFCDEDGTREFNKVLTCPACETSLTGKYDIIRTDLNPTEQYKSMVLAGQKPETALEIFSRAMSFWTYQAQLERIYQGHVATKAKEKNTQMEQFYEEALSRLQTELNSVKTKLTAAKKELENTKKLYNEASEKISEKTRQYQKIQAVCDGLRRKCISTTSFDTGDLQGPIRTTPASRSHPMFQPFVARDDALRRTSYEGDRGGGDRALHMSPHDREFVLRPMGTPVIGAGSADNVLANIQDRFNLEIGTPSGGANTGRKPAKHMS